MEIIIGEPTIQEESDRVFLCAPVTIGGCEKEAYFSVEPEFAQYLTPERSDAFIVGFLTTAMRMGADIVCQAPMTKRLEYQLNQYLIPCMANNMEIYHHMKVVAPVADDTLPCARAVGTGWTGGVDSTYTLFSHARQDNPYFHATHLVVANNGALESDHNFELMETMVNRAREGIAKELGLQVVSIDSNLQELQDENYLAVAGFRLPAVVLAVQKLFGVFLNSGAYEFPTFSFDQTNSAYYELLPLQMFETDCTVFYSACGAVPRIKKLEELSDIPYAQEHLHPCIYQSGDNCGTCGKCVRTMVALYALGTLDKFSGAFDVERFYQEKDEYIAKVILKRNSQHYAESLALMEEQGMEIPEGARRKARIIEAATKVAQKRYGSDEQ